MSYENSQNNKVIDNNFTIIGMGFGFWLIITTFLAYSFFFSGVVDWNQNIPIIEIIKQESEKSARPFLAALFWLISTHLAIKSFRKLIRYPKHFTTLSNNKFLNIPIATESSVIQHSEVTEIKKSFFPMFGNRKKHFHLSHLFLLFVVPISQLIFFILYILKFIYWTFLKIGNL